MNGAPVGYGTAASVAAALGGNSTVDANGNVVKPAYALDGTTYSDVGAALAAVDAKAVAGSTNGVAYDTSARDKVTLGGVGTSKLVTVSNVADGVANNDAVNVKQLKAMGANIDSSGNVMGAFVAYDDTSKGKVTLGGNGATTPVALSNVAAGQISSNSKDAVNGSQLYGTAASVAAALGGNTTVGSDGKVSKPSYSVNGDTYNDVGSAINAVSSLATTGSTLGVVYDSSARDKLTLGGSGATTPVEVSNVAAATADNDAVNLKQLKDAGLNVDTAGNVTNSFVAYDNASKGTVTFGGLGSTTPVQLKNVAAASDLTDAVNFGQMQTYVAQNAGSGGGHGERGGLRRFDEEQGDPRRCRFHDAGDADQCRRGFVRDRRGQLLAVLEPPKPGEQPVRWWHRVTRPTSTSTPRARAARLRLHQVRMRSQLVTVLSHRVRRRLPLARMQ